MWGCVEETKILQIILLIYNLLSYCFEYTIPYYVNC